MTKLSKNQSKKMAGVLGVSTKELGKLMRDLQEMELLRYVSDNIWEVHNGIKWNKIYV